MPFLAARLGSARCGAATSLYYRVSVGAALSQGDMLRLSFSVISMHFLIHLGVVFHDFEAGSLLLSIKVYISLA